MNKSIHGIYLIKRMSEEEGERYYVGLSNDIFKRWREHCCNKTGQHIDKEICKLGVENFSFSIIEVVKLSELKDRESFWIKKYRDEYTDDQLYNRSETSNVDPMKEIKNNIKRLFQKDLGQSIYPIAEYYDIPWTDVVEIREPLLKKHGLRFDRKTKNIVDIKTGEIPEYWRGGTLTKNLAIQVDNLLRAKENINVVANQCNISESDLQFYVDHKGHGDYSYAQELD